MNTDPSIGKNLLKSAVIGFAGIVALKVLDEVLDGDIFAGLDSLTDAITADPGVY
jgi:hypothetical protein